jgi:hypothetical protein
MIQRKVFDRCVQFMPGFLSLIADQAAAGTSKY